MVIYPYPLDQTIIETLRASGYGVNLSNQGFCIQSPPGSTYCQEDLPTILLISWYMYNLPGKELFDNAVPEGLEKTYKALRNTCQWIAIAFVDESLQLEIQPLEQLRREGEIVNKWDQQYCEHYARRMYSLWKLIRNGFPVISKATPDIADTAFNLFCKMLRDEIEFPLHQRAKKRFRDSVPERCRLYQSMDRHKPLLAEEIEENSNHPLVYVDEWMKEIYPSLKEAAETNHQIQADLEDFDVCSRAFEQFNVRALKAKDRGLNNL